MSYKLGLVILALLAVHAHSAHSEEFKQVLPVQGPVSVKEVKATSDMEKDKLVKPEQKQALKQLYTRAEGKMISVVCYGPGNQQIYNESAAEVRVIDDTIIHLYHKDGSLQASLVHAACVLETTTDN